MYCDVLERTFHQFGQASLDKELPAIVQQRIIDLGPDAEVDQDQLVDRGIPELFQMSKSAFSLLSISSFFVFTVAFGRMFFGDRDVCG